MQALEVRHLRRVACLGKHLEALLHQLDAAAAQHRLLAEQVGFGLLLERGLDHARLAAADRRGVGKRHVARLLRGIAMHGDQHRYPAAAGVGRAHGVARRLGRHHPHVEIRARLNLAVVDVEAVREGERAALPDVRFDLGLVDRSDVLVGHQHHHDVRALDRVADLRDLEPGLLRLVPGRAALAQPDRDLDPGVVQVERVRMPLRTVAQYGDLLALDERKVGVFVVVHLHRLPLVSRPAKSGCRARCPRRRCALSPGSRSGRAPG